MIGLSEFFDRLDHQAHDIPHTELVDDDRLQLAAEISLPMLSRWCERAGIELDDLRREVVERIQGPVHVVSERLDRGDDVGSSLVLLGASAGLQFFLAGVLWEQDRHLPDIDVGGAS